MTIYVFGNSLIKEDRLALSILPALKKKFPQIDFQTADPNENFPPPDVSCPMILDTVCGIRKPVLLRLKDFALPKTPSTPHDYDLLLHLLLLKKIGRIKDALIIGLPAPAVLKRKRAYSAETRQSKA